MQWPVKKEINLDSDDQHLLSLHTLSSSIPHHRLHGGNHFQHDCISPLNQSQVSYKKIWWINMPTARHQAREWIFHVTKHISRTYWLECAFPAVIGGKHERGGLRYGNTAALSTLPAAQRAQIGTVIACSDGAWAEPQLGPRYLLGSTPKHLPSIQGNSNISPQPGISTMFVNNTV